MKFSLSFIVLALCCLTSVHAQVVFLEDFDGVGGSTAGGAGTYSFPAGWTLVNVDNRTPDAGVSFVNDAWERREDFANNVADSAAFSTSWYSPTGAADDWMWTPQITVPANGQLRWNAVAYDSDYPDGYEVRVMVSPTTPTGSAGSLGNMVSASTQVFSVAAENNTWTTRSVSLAAYSGQTVQIAFRNNSNNMFVLLIDDVEVRGTVNDVSMTSINFPSEYTIVPLSQASALDLGYTFTNTGTATLTNLVATVTIQDGTGAVVHTASAPAVASLNAGAAISATFPGFTPTSAAELLVIYGVSCAETDANLADNQDTTYITIDPKVYARDNGLAVGSMGIGAGDGGYVGQMFDVVTPMTIDSVMVFFTRGYTGENAALAIFQVIGGTPSSTVYATTDTLQYADDNAAVITFPINGGALTLPAGQYVFAAIEFDSTLAVGNTPERFTTGTVWVNWPSSPLGGWGNAEAFGPNFARPLIIRPMESSCTTTTVTLTGNTTGCGSVTLTGPANLNNYSWSTLNGIISGPDAITLTESGSVGFSATDAAGCPVEASAMVVVNPLPVPVISQAGPVLSTAGTFVTYQWLMGGVPVNGANSAQFTATANGNYAVTVTDANGCSGTSVSVDVTGIAIDKGATETVSLYPNPVRDILTIEAGNGKNAAVEIVDAAGRVLMTVSGNRADVSGLAPGIYLVRITTTAGTAARSFIKE